MGKKFLALITALAILMVFPGTVFAGTQTWTNDGTTITFTTPNSYAMCSETGGNDVISVSGLPAGWSLDGWVQTQYVLPGGGRQAIDDYDVQFTSDGTQPFTLTVYYPPVSQWPITDAVNNTRELHVDISILVVYNEQGDIVTWIGPEEAPGTLGPGNDWDVWCQYAPPPSSPGTGTPGYWGQHPEAWPVDSIVIGGVTYSKASAIAAINSPVKKDKTFTMFPALVAAKLNVLIGNNSSCISSAITAADAWMAANPLGSKVAGNSAAWAKGEPYYWALDSYNNGLMCAPARD